MEMKNLTHKEKEEIAADSFEKQWKLVKTDLHRVQFKNGYIAATSYYISSYEQSHKWYYLVYLFFEYYGNKRQLTTGQIRVRDVIEVW